MEIGVVAEMQVIEHFEKNLKMYSYIPLKDRGIDFNELLSSENREVIEKLQIFDQLMRDKTNIIETLIKEQFLTYDDFEGEIKTIGTSMYKIVFESIHSSWTESMSVIPVCKILWIILQSY